MLYPWKKKNWMDLVFCIHLICVFLLWQSEALPRIRCREQRVRCRGSSQTHHGHERGRLHVLPDGGGWGCLQETVLSLHQERHHTRHGKIPMLLSAGPAYSCNISDSSTVTINETAARVYIYDLIRRLLKHAFWSSSREFPVWGVIRWDDLNLYIQELLRWRLFKKNQTEQSWVDPSWPSAKSERNCSELWEMPTFDASFLFPRWRKCTKKHTPTSGQTLYTKRNPRKTSRRRGEFRIPDFAF